LCNPRLSTAEEDILCAVATYLDSIVAWHRTRAAHAAIVGSQSTTGEVDLAAIRQQRIEKDPYRGFAAALQGPGLSVIAEVKRRSPSKGALSADLDPADVACAYESGGAACLSVLTDVLHFGGSIADLQAARAATKLPVIRKDFTVCAADVVDAALMGADCVLLIVAVLTDEELGACAETAKALGIDVLWETHDEAEVARALQFNAAIIGVNQRDLHTFAVDQERAVRVAASIPSSVVRVAESGVRGPEDAAVLRGAGYDAVLVGESIVTSENRSEAVRALRNAGDSA
jgi:indole-3-glycerol phosphate synthase